VSDALHWLDPAARARSEAGLHRVLRPRPAGPSQELDLASNDYLGLSRHPLVVEAGVQALRDYGAGSTGSRLVTGSLDLHAALEQALADHTGSEAGLVFSSGYLANLGAVAALAGPGTLVVSGGGNHASLVDACRLSRADVVVTPQSDPGAVRRVLAARTQERALVVTDAVYSVDGALAPLAALHEAARAHGATLLVDEAHGLGVVGPTGQGASAAAGLAGEPDVVLTVTLSKALGSQGGAVLGPAAVREHLIDTARTFIFDTGLNPAAAGAALAALRLVDAGRVAALHRATAELADAVGVPRSSGAVVQVPVGDPVLAVQAQQDCAAAGVRVGCFRPPSVPQGGSCLRLAARADLTDADLERGAAVVRGALRR
jgi:8-amino-7-oxononanoate synthase